MKHLENFDTVPGLAHRGLHNPEDGIVENSSSAIKAAMDAGLGIEIDVQMSRDLVPMVFHDHSLSRLTALDVPLSFLTAREIVEVPYLTGSDKIISLEQCLSLINGSVPLLIEVKSHWTGKAEMERSIADVCKGYSGPLGVMSFDSDVIERLQSLNCNFPLGFVSGKCPPKDWGGLSEQDRLEGVAHFNRAKSLTVDFLAHDISDIMNLHLTELIETLDIPLFSWTIISKTMLHQALKHSAMPILEFTGSLQLKDMSF